MHYILEILIPPMSYDKIDNYLKQTLKEFREYDEEDNRNLNGFYDYFLIGGRFSSSKMRSCLDEEKMNQFYDEMNNKNVTVSSLVWGKQELSPSSQIPMVDQLWKEFFPEWPGNDCPLFSHSENAVFSDIMTLGDCKKHDAIMDHQVSSFAIAHDERVTGFYGLKHLLHQEYWNGCVFQKTDFDGSLRNGLERYNELVLRDTKHAEKNLADDPQKLEDFKRRKEITDDWLVVTVDYHN